MPGLSVLRPQGPVSLTSGILGLQSILCFLGFSVKKTDNFRKDPKV